MEFLSPIVFKQHGVFFSQVAVHLLSDKEKKDMVQLVNTMVSYSMTYKNQKADPVPSILRHEAVVEDSMLSFDPPIGDLINFKVSVFSCGITYEMRFIVLSKCPSILVLSRAIHLVTLFLPQL